MAISGIPSLNPQAIKPVYIGSNAMSPFHDFYSNDQTILRLAAGRFFAHYNGEDIEQAYWALRNAAVLVDVPERPVEISGLDAISFLDHVFTRQSGKLKNGSGHYTLACTHEGGLFMDGILFRLDEKKFWFVQPDGDLDTWLLAHRHNVDVSISDPQSRVLQLQGPRSLEIIHAATKGGVNQHMGYFRSGFHEIGGQRVFISRTGWTGELGYEIYTLGPATDCKRLWQALIENGTPKGMVFSSMQAINIRRIEAGIFDSGSDFDPSMTPDEAGLSRFVDLEKEFFIGKEALVTGRCGNRIYGVRCQDYIPKGGDLVLDGIGRVGHLTTGAYSPEFRAGIGYVRFDHAEDWIGKKLLVASDDGSTYFGEIISLPFYDQDKLKPKMANLDPTRESDAEYTSKRSGG
ncbi:MAG: aminomethyltransferase family protein [Proteobacteria bacterium]|jgi:glycine cleavage system aminomethyltransferase T|nr:aminomethyltransferase family protein [Pseudomonadota bacterium]